MTLRQAAQALVATWCEPRSFASHNFQVAMKSVEDALAAPPLEDILAARCAAAYQLIGGMRDSKAHPDDVEAILDALSGADIGGEDGPAMEAEINRLPSIRWLPAAPPPGRDEVRAKLEELWRDGYDFGSDPCPMSSPESDRLIAELLDLWPQGGDDLK